MSGPPYMPVGVDQPARSPQPELPRMKCDCCQLNYALGVASSTLGAMSLAYCAYCLNHDAEPEWMFRFTLDSAGFDVAPWVRELTTFVKGRYVPWDTWVIDKHPDEHAFDDME